jgi:CHAT domain-containing protein/tetratricopeptide (TPR) repeat protein
VTVTEAMDLAMKLVNSGRYADAKSLLLSLQSRLEDWPEDPHGLFALHMLARCYRAERDFGPAREAARRAIAIAQSIGSPAAAALALEGAAMIERDDDHVVEAGTYFVASAAIEGRLGNREGRAAALTNYASMLTDNGIEGAESLLRDARRDVEPGSRYYPMVADNLAAELGRQGRYGEAVEYSEAAVSGYLAVGLTRDAHISLRMHSRLLAAAGRMEESTDAFIRAHDLIWDLKQAEIDDDHYAVYGELVERIEQGFREVAKNSDMLNNDAFKELARRHATIDPVDLLVQVCTKVASEAQKTGMDQLEAGHYSAAVKSLFKARRYWHELRAIHRIVSVDYSLASAFVEIGDIERALPLVMRSRTLAHELGDAWREGHALSLLARIGDATAGQSSLDYLLEAEALHQCIKRRMGLPLETPLDGGVHAAQLANICADAQAYGLAEAYHEQALSVARLVHDEAGSHDYRYIYRLANFYEMLRAAGHAERAAAILAELQSAAGSLSADPRVAGTLERIISRAAFNSGERTQEVLHGLLAGCRAYEEERDHARGLDLSGFAAVLDPPYEEAALVALGLGDTALALRLLERCTARKLVDAIHINAGSRDALEDPAALPPIGADIGIWLFMTLEAIIVLALDGASSAITESIVVDDSEMPLRPVLATFVDSADGERRERANDGALDAVLKHPTFRRLADTVAEVTQPGRKAWLIPHGSLHNAPLQLLPTPTAQFAIMPSLAVAAKLPPLRPLSGQPGIVVFGDSTDDLPFARAEARLIAGKHGAVAIGGECTIERLRTALIASPSVLHIACHGRFDRVHPDRSGLLLAAPADKQLAGTSTARLLTLPEVAQLPLDGQMVVLSACSSGMETLRAGESNGLVSALLAGGAATVIAAQWPISDLSAMLLMTRFYERLARQPPRVDLLATLDSATASIRAMTAEDLINFGFDSAERLLTLGEGVAEAGQVAGRCLSYALAVLGDRASAALADSMVTVSAEAGDASDQLEALRALIPSPGLGTQVHPFAHPRHWGPFKIVGRTMERGPLEATGDN